MANDDAKLKCAECNRNKKLHLFYKRSNTKRGYTKECKSCYRKSASYRNALEARYQRDFGISLSEYDVLLQEQNGRCFVCLKRPASKRLSVDHDHQRERTTGMRSSVRGLLCNKCNRFLGHVGDDPDAGQRLTDYLTRPTWVERTGL